MSRFWLSDPEPELPLDPKRKKAAWLMPTVLLTAVLTTVGGLAYVEMRDSTVQADMLSSLAAKATFSLEPDANVRIRFPKAGPYNERLGYSYMPFFIKSLQSDDFTIAAQARASKTFNRLVKHGFYPLYSPKTTAGLTLYDRFGDKIYAASYPTRVFNEFDQIPPLLVSTLLFIENRELLKDGAETRNPVIEWDRFFFALFGHIFHHFVPGANAGGGSTLATQTEKFRFSPHGQTGNAIEKIRQIVSASLRVYLDGPDTREARKKIALDYMNSTPLSARPGFGEIHSIGDGLWAFFGLDLKDTVTALGLPETSPAYVQEKARVYRAALGLILAQRRPSYYLQSNPAALENLIDATLERLEGANVISSALRRATQAERLKFLPEAPKPVEPPYIEQKAVNAFRTHLMKLVGLKKLYEVDRLDISAHTTLDAAAQTQLVGFLKKMGDVDFVKSIGLYGFRLLKPENDPAKIKWSVVLYERGSDSNKIRLQADNIDEPFDMNEGMKLDLGSTAKLRTLVTYLEIIAELHRRYAGLNPDDLAEMAEEAPDVLTQWSIGWLQLHTDADLETMLRAALERKYSGSAGEVFFTGGGAHVFHNFESKEDYETYDLHGAFKESVNLVFVRVMRDIVNYTIAQGAQNREELLDDPEEPARRVYLERFADQEGSVFLNRAINEYQPLNAAQRLERITQRARKSAVARTVLFRSLYPQADQATYMKYMNAVMPGDSLGTARLAKLYKDYPVDRFNLADRAYLTGLNPMELWLLPYWEQQPKATRSELLRVSRPVRIESYAWLFRPSLKRAQDTRIRIMLEEDAFARIQKRWARLGYPFSRLVPSYATAIGSSADRPGALAELVGILLAGGRRLPVERFEDIEMAAGTPFHTQMKHDESLQPPQVLEPAIAKLTLDVMREVVEGGTAKRVKDVYKDSEGKALPVGGKTGTGDHRYDEFGAGGRLLGSRVVNRTGTFVFYLGDRYFGVITAHVAGQDAANYVFTSALSAQMLRALAPVFNPLVNRVPQMDDMTPPVSPTQPLPPI